ncbi:tetratricopeptide repeat-containing sulfotransferase family protein [Leisingera sp. NJS204]|uniref:tetratricopeptide repeat-containing sulfotransferase family protein n=1 Tax=Leisingera sp. NJS204 TaxID=2508307 RepID=UPI001012EE83|nr:tetratricopeptide repeat-containing sulfotransferase family protein [Leisingera sp. NJS204]QAX29358.1 sulfotransferase family protein [Leisingera sp. NJS204]
MTLQNDLQAAFGFLNQGKFKQALKQSKAGMKRHKTHPDFPNIAGISLSGLGKHRDAVPHFKKALALAPGFHDARKNLAQTLLFLQQGGTAMKLLDRVLADLPDDQGALYLKAQAQLVQNDPEAAIATASDALARDGKQPRMLRLRAMAWKNLGDEKAALEDYQATLRLNPDDVDALTNISLPLARLMRQDEATEAAQKAVALAPENLEARRRLASQLISNGESDAARTHCLAILDLDPKDSQVLEMLARLNSREQNAELLPVAQKALKAAAPRSLDRANVSFALARIADQGGDKDGFAAHNDEANACMAAQNPYDYEDSERQFSRIMAAFPEAIPPAETEVDGPRPIYVVGMPRSGTTLTETVIGLHPDVFPLGERGVPAFLLHPYIDKGLDFPPEAARNFVAEDISRLPQMPEGTAAYVDKMPDNYRLLGHLLTAYPDARFVHLCRDPRDVALSIWRGYFSGSSLTYAYDLKAMAHRFNLYGRLMQHWRQVMPGRIYDLRYEDFVAGIEGQSRKLADFCGLTWVEDMAHPERHEGQVLTLSNTQVRQTAHTRSIGKWEKYADVLAPFIDGLDPEIWPEIKG